MSIDEIYFVSYNVAYNVMWFKQRYYALEKWIVFRIKVAETELRYT